MDYLELKPASSVRRFVRCYWFLTGASHAEGPTADPALPDGSPELIINLADPFRAVPAGRAPQLQPLTMLVGQITGPFAVEPTGRIDLVGVRFEPFGAVGVFNPMSRLTDRWAGGADIPSAQLSELRAALHQAGPPEARAAILDDHLGCRLTEGRQPDPRVEAAAGAIRATHGACALDQLGQELGTTPRTLQRLFQHDVGITPKLLARITRFQRVFSAWRTDPTTLARVAAACGYFDQSHLIRDFQDFAGAAPAGFLAGLPEFTGFFTAGPKPSR